MKNIFLVFLLLFTMESFAQQNNDWQRKKEQFCADKVAFITQDMHMSVEQAQKFWPIYNQYNKQFEEIFAQRRMYDNPEKLNSDLSEQESKEILDILTKSYNKETQLRTQFYGELSKYFDSKFILKYYISEKNFRRYLIDKTKK